MILQKAVELLVVVFHRLFEQEHVKGLAIPLFQVVLNGVDDLLQTVPAIDQSFHRSVYFFNLLLHYWHLNIILVRVFVPSLAQNDVQAEKVDYHSCLVD